MSEGPEASRGWEGSLNKHGDAETRGSSGHLSPKGKLSSVVPEVPKPSSQKGTTAPTLSAINQTPARVPGLP